MIQGPWLTIAEHKALVAAVRYKHSHMADNAARYRWVGEPYPAEELFETYNTLLAKLEGDAT